MRTRVKEIHVICLLSYTDSIQFSNSSCYEFKISEQYSLSHKISQISIGISFFNSLLHSITESITSDSNVGRLAQNHCQLQISIHPLGSRCLCSRQEQSDRVERLGHLSGDRTLRTCGRSGNRHCRHQSIRQGFRKRRRRTW